MSRRRSDTRADAAQARALLADASHSIRGPVPLTPDGTAAGRRSNEVDTVPETHASAARVARLNAYTPKGGTPREVASLRRVVVNAVARIPGSSNESDDANVGVLYSFALYMLKTHGAFNIVDDLTDTRIDEFIRMDCGHLAGSSRQTYRSTLRRVRRGDSRKAMFSRSRARAPLSRNEWLLLNRDAEVAGNLAQDAKTLLYLTGSAGLQPHEVHIADTTWVVTRPGLTLLQVLDPKTAEFREVPVYGKAARHLTSIARERPGTLLFRHNYKARANATSSFKDIMVNAFPSWQNYDSTRSRHRFLVNLLRSGVPFDVVCNVAGINPGTHLPTDLLFHMPYRDINEVDTYMRGLSTRRDRSGGAA